MKGHPLIALAIAALGLVYLGLMTYVFVGDPIPRESRSGLAFLLGVLALMVAGAELALRKNVNPVALATGFVAVAGAATTGVDDLGPSLASTSLLQFVAVLLLGLSPVLVLFLVIRPLRG